MFGILALDYMVECKIAFLFVFRFCASCWSSDRMLPGGETYVAQFVTAVNSNTVGTPLLSVV